MVKESCPHSQRNCTGYTPCVSCDCCPCRCRQTKTELSGNLYYGGTPATSMCHDYPQNEGMKLNANIRHVLNDLAKDCPSKKASEEYYEKQQSKPTDVRQNKTHQKKADDYGMKYDDSYKGYKHCKSYCEPYAKEYCGTQK